MASSIFTEQISVEEATRFDLLEDGSYNYKIPPSICFATVALGGLSNSIVHKAALDFVSKSTNVGIWQNVLSMYTQFFRPTLAFPITTKLEFAVTNISKHAAVLRFEISQNKKLCMTGFVTVRNSTDSGQTVAEVGWSLLPPPLEVCLQELESDKSSSWSGYLTPFDANTYRKPQSYVRYFIPVERFHVHYIDQWVEPAWPAVQDPQKVRASRPLWTNENIHFIIDNALPIINDIIDPESGMYQKIVQAGLAQKGARLNQESDRLWGQGLKDHELKFPWIISTISISTDIKKLLPALGCRWLFMRNTVKSIIGNRMTMEIVILDVDLTLVAFSQHICQIIPVDDKRAKQANL